MCELVAQDLVQRLVVCMCRVGVGAALLCVVHSSRSQQTSALGELLRGHPGAPSPLTSTSTRARMAR